MLAREFPNEPAIAKFTTEVGALTRNAAKRTLTEIGFRHDVEIEIQEHKGLLESDLHVKVKGPVKNVDAAVSEYTRRIELLNETDDQDQGQGSKDECGDPTALRIACLLVIVVIATAMIISLIF